VEVTAVMLAYNEEGCIDGVGRDWLKVVTRLRVSKVVAVNNNSTRDIFLGGTALRR
jgi:hypothetical protein